MNDKHHKIDEILKQSVQEVELDSPSGNFTKDLMSKIQAIGIKEPIAYSSLIPHPLKIGLGLIFVCVLVYFSIGTNSDAPSLLSPYFKLPDFSFSIPDLQFNIEFSNVMVYGLVFFMVLFSIQIYYIKTKVGRLNL